MCVSVYVQGVYVHDMHVFVTKTWLQVERMKIGLFFGRQTGVRCNTLQSTGETPMVHLSTELLSVEHKPTKF